MTVRSLKPILEAFIQDVWNRGDASCVGRYVAPAYTIHHDPGDPWEGQVLCHEGYCRRLIQSRAPFPDQTFDIRDLCEDGNRVVMSWLWQATHREDIPGFPATGKSILMSGATTYFFDADARLTGHWQVTDRLGVWRQLHANQA